MLCTLYATYLLSSPGAPKKIIQAPRSKSPHTPSSGKSPHTPASGHRAAASPASGARMKRVASHNDLASQGAEATSPKESRQDHLARYGTRICAGAACMFVCLCVLLIWWMRLCVGDRGEREQEKSSSNHNAASNFSLCADWHNRVPRKTSPQTLRNLNPPV